jgi:hypothetical protein
VLTLSGHLKRKKVRAGARRDQFLGSHPESKTKTGGAHIVATEDDLDAPPLGILRNLLVDKVLQVLREAGHEGRACRCEVGR